MARKIWVAGEQLNAVDLNNNFAEVVRIKKPSNQTKNNNATIASDPDLTFNMAVGQKYAIRMVIFVVTDNTARFKWQLTGPSSPGLVIVSASYNTPSNIIDSNFNTAYGTTNTISASDYSAIRLTIDALIHNDANAGAFAFQWAQQVANATDTKVLMGSYLEYMLIA